MLGRRRGSRIPWPDEKEEAYFAGVRRDIADEIPGNCGRILDVGCGLGCTGEALKQAGKAREVIGIEVDGRVAQEARRRLDCVVEGNIESLCLPFESESFEVILLLDVLEHLCSPWKVLDRMVGYLTRSGWIIVSIPNLRHWRVLLPLILWGRFEYSRSGILDAGHLRFFTKRSAVDLVTHPQLRIRKVAAKMGPRATLVNKVTGCCFADFLAVQYLIVAQRIG